MLMTMSRWAQGLGIFASMALWVLGEGAHAPHLREAPPGRAIAHEHGVVAEPASVHVHVETGR